MRPVVRRWVKVGEPVCAAVGLARGVLTPPRSELVEKVIVGAACRGTMVPRRRLAGERVVCGADCLEARVRNGGRDGAGGVRVWMVASHEVNVTGFDVALRCTGWEMEDLPGRRIWGRWEWKGRRQS